MAATRNPRLRLLHIRDEIEGLSVALQGVTFEQYRESYTLRRVTERALQIISEAARALPDELTEKHSNTPWHAIIGIGNVLRHEYQHLDDRRLWEVVTIHLPQLYGVVGRMLAELPE